MSSYSLVHVCTADVSTYIMYVLTCKRLGTLIAEISGICNPTSCCLRIEEPQIVLQTINVFLQRQALTTDVLRLANQV